MGINNKLTYLQQTKEGIKTAIQNKGVDVLDTDTFRSYAEKIGQIEGGGSGGSGGEVIEAVVDESVLPIESGKKVVVADIQATGQGAGALMPFDIVPYGNSPISGAYQSIRDCVFFNSKTTSTYAPTIRYKKVGEYKWEGKQIETLNYYIHSNDKITLLYAAETPAWGSFGQFYNHITDKVENIIFDIEMPQTDDTQKNNYFLTHDSKYLWAVQLTSRTNVNSGGAEGKAAMYRVEENKETGKVYAYQIVSPIDITKPSGVQYAIVSVDSYDLYIGKVSGKTTDTLLTFNEDGMRLSYQTGTRYISYPPQILAKNWYAYRREIYYGTPINTEMKAFTLSGSSVDLWYKYNNIAYSFLRTNFIAYKFPLNAERPKVEDFYVYPEHTLIGDEGPCFINDDEILYASTAANYPAKTIPTIMNFKTGEIKDFSGIQQNPIFLLDDGTGYFWKDDGIQLGISGKSVEIIAPVEGSYTNGEVIKTLTATSDTILYKQIAYEKNLSSYGDSYIYYTTHPMLFLNDGKSFIFQNVFDNSTYQNMSYSGHFFKDPLEEAEKFIFNDGTLSVDVNKAYTTPSTNNLNFTVFSGEGITSYTTTEAKSGLCFEFEGNLYMYKFSNFITLAGDGCYKVNLNNSDMTANFELIDDGSELSPIINYITANNMHPNYKYPSRVKQSVYNRPVMTKDGKYLVGLAGNHTTHYSKIEKNSAGYPVLNVYEFPDNLKDLLFEQEILYFEAYYPSGFGIQLASGNFLMCEYEQGLDVDLKITVYNPLNTTSYNGYYIYQTHFTSHKHYWYSHACTYFQSSAGSGYVAGCGRREDLSSTYQKKVYSMKHSFAGADHVTGYLTGESYKNDNGKLIAEVEVLRK